MPSSDLELQRMPIYTKTRIVRALSNCEAMLTANTEHPNNTTKKRAFHKVRK